VEGFVGLCVLGIGSETEDSDFMNHPVKISVVEVNTSVVAQLCKYSLVAMLELEFLVFSARWNIYISRLCYDVSVRLFVRLSVTEVHWRIIANLGSNSDPNLPRIAVAVHAGAREGIIAGKSGGIISHYANHC